MLWAIGHFADYKCWQKPNLHLLNKPLRNTKATTSISFTLTSEPSSDHTVNPNILTLQVSTCSACKYHASYLTWSVSRPSPFPLHPPTLFTAHSTANVFWEFTSSVGKCTHLLAVNGFYSVEEHQAQSSTTAGRIYYIGRGAKKTESIRGRHSVNSLLPEREQSWEHRGLCAGRWPWQKAGWKRKKCREEELISQPFF